jgi:hypothetical protein
MAASEDEETQKNGMVIVLTTIARKGPISIVSAKRLAGVFKACPIYWPGIHFCVDSPGSATNLSLWRMFMRPQERIRFRTHVGK